MNRLKKMSLAILILIVIASICCTSVRADDGDNFDLNAFDNTTANGVDSANDMVNSAAAQIISIARIICVTIAIVMLLVIAMKYMISAPGDRADIKKHAVNYVIGAFVLFGVSGILTILNNVAQSIGS